MKIVILHGFTSSSVFDPTTDDVHDDDSSYRYLGGPNFRPQIEEADVVIALWGSDEPIVIKAPEDVEIQGALWRHLKPPRMTGVQTPEQWRREAFPDEAS